ncbi:Vitamin B12 transporter BtuB [Carnimonas sp. R-84981]|uniref:TonB-dependent receptor n=1 Tax=Carnimonas bestiolae TaxID=3402172 RepID=UPI003EDC5672
MTLPPGVPSSPALASQARPPYRKKRTFTSLTFASTLSLTLSLSAHANAQSSSEVAAPAEAAPAEAASAEAAPAEAAPAEAAPAEAAPAEAAPAEAAPAEAAPAEAAPAEAAAAAVPAAAASGAAGANTQRLQDVSVTGTALNSPTAETAQPITVYHAEELKQRGITSAEQFLQQLGVNNSSQGNTSSQMTGAYSGGASYADLRGLGSDKTLVLLNGRRIVANAYSSSAVDLNSIPFAAISRIEVLTDSASALYGSDAMAGVINFITKKNYQGLNVETNQSTPTHSGGGQKQDYSATWGTGDLEKDGYNWMGTLDYQNQRGQNHSHSFYRDTDYWPDYGSLYHPGVYQGTSQEGSSKYYQTACNGGIPSSRKGICASDAWGWGNYIDPQQNTSLYTALSFDLGGDNTGELSYFWAHSNARKTSYPDILNLDVEPENPNYPAAVAANSDLDRSKPVKAKWVSPLEQNVVGFKNDTKRIQYAQFGSFGGWKYDTAIAYNHTRAKWRGNDGYLDGEQMQELVKNGELNPFEPPGEADLPLIRRARWSGQLMDATGDSVNWDGHLSHSLGDWFGAGPVQVALGAEASHQRFEQRMNDSPAQSSGLSASYVKASRDQQAVWTELNVPLLESLETTASWRYDRFSQVGHTANPKFSFRYQPLDNLTFRGSYSTSFVAPSLYDMYSPSSLTYAGSGLNDPVLCPSGSGGQGCNEQFRVNNGGNSDLKPMKSESWQFGFIYEPVDRLVTSADFWWYRIRNDVDLPSYQYALDHAGPGDICRYGEECAKGQSGTPGTIYYFNNSVANIGKIHTNGVDLKASYLLPSSWGDWRFGANFTHVFQYDESNDEGWENGLGRMDSYDKVQFRWKGSAYLNWTKGPWSAGLTYNYQTGYKDTENQGSEPAYKYHNRVSHYDTFDVNAGYAFASGVRVVAGARNVFDTKPPYTSFTSYGIDSRYASSLGRELYTRLQYSF